MVSKDVLHLLPLPQVSLRQICLYHCHLDIFERVTHAVYTNSQRFPQTLQFMQADISQRDN